MTSQDKQTCQRCGNGFFHVHKVPNCDQCGKCNCEPRRREK